MGIYTAEVIALLRAKPVFIDILTDTFNMDPEKLETAITPRIKAIMPEGIYGQCADMTRINTIALEQNIPVNEDGDHSFGATQYGKKSLKNGYLSKADNQIINYRCLSALSLTPTPKT